MKLINQTQYRVFCTNPSFSGNPTTVCELKEEVAPSAMLAHSQSLSSIDNGYFLRDPKSTEVRAFFFSHNAPLLICGHSALAMARHLLHDSSEPRLTLVTPNFSHLCRYQESRAWLELPQFSYVKSDPHIWNQWLLGQGIEVAETYLFPYQVHVVRLSDESAVRRFDSSSAKFSDLNELAPGALILCASSGSGYVFRYFTPWHGKTEDSATGSAHCYLSSIFCENESVLSARQISPMGDAQMTIQRESDSVWITGEIRSETDCPM